MHARSTLTGTVALFVLATAGCGSDSTATPSTAVSTVTAAPSTTSQPATITPAAVGTTTTTSTMLATTTTSTTTTSTTTTPTTLATTTVPVAVGAGWSAVEPRAVSVKALPPCCAETWHGDVSPELAPAGQQLADGPYAVTAQWGDDPAQPLALELFRFEQCALLPEFTCEPQGQGVPYEPTQLGVDRSTSRPLTLALDDTVRVVVVGWDDATLGDPFVIQQANGTDLARLATTVEQSYATVFAERFLAGEDPSAIIADVAANPRGGLRPAVSASESFIFTPVSGPPLLFQTVFPNLDGHRAAGRGTDVLAIRSIEVIDGQITLYVYAAYYP